jgi:hypothetical protein
MAKMYLCPTHFLLRHCGKKTVHSDCSRTGERVPRGQDFLITTDSIVSVLVVRYCCSDPFLGLQKRMSETGVTSWSNSDTFQRPRLSTDLDNSTCK